MSEPHAGPLVAVVPVRSLSGSKSRLGAVLDPEEREELVTTLLHGVLAALAAAPSVARTIVVSPDDDVLELARAAGATALREIGGGLNVALDEGRVVAMELGAGSLLVLPADLPGASPEAIEALVASVLPPPSVALVPDRHGSGTNALLLSPPDAIAFAFGPESRRDHHVLAIAAGARYAELGGALALDLDTPEDLLLVPAAGGGTET